MGMHFRFSQTTRARCKPTTPFSTRFAVHRENRSNARDELEQQQFKRLDIDSTDDGHRLRRTSALKSSCLSSHFLFIFNSSGCKIKKNRDFRKLRFFWGNFIALVKINFLLNFHSSVNKKKNVNRICVQLRDLVSTRCKV